MAKSKSTATNLSSHVPTSSSSDHPGSPKAERKEWSHNLHVSPATVHHMKAVFSIVRISTDENMTTFWMIWTWIWNFGGIFLNTTLQAAVHLGQDYEANLRYVKNHLWDSVGQLVSENEKLISEQTEITGVSSVNFKEFTWMSTSSWRSKSYQITNAKT